MVGGACIPPLLSLAQKKQKYNVLMIVCDDLNDYVHGFGGHPQAKTPNVAKLAKSGVSFIRAYSNNPVCAPSRASFLTGIYPLHRAISSGPPGMRILFLETVKQSWNILGIMVITLPGQASLCIILKERCGVNTDIKPITGLSGMMEKTG